MSVIGGRTIMTEHHPLDSQAQISVGPLDDIDPTYTAGGYFDDETFMRNRGRKSLVRLSRNLDIACYVPKELLRDTRFASERIDTPDIIVMEEALIAEAIKNLLPDKGIMLRFNGTSRWPSRPELETY